jgi:GTPase
MSAKKISEPTGCTGERAFLVGAGIKSQPSLLTLEDSLAELSRLAETAGLQVVGELKQRMEKPNPETYIGAGKVEELIVFLEETLADVVIFDNELSPRHLRELENHFGEKVRVIDRTALILDIFAQHAITREGFLQVELAQYEYRLPRLTRAWTHLARQAGGGAGRTGSIGGVGLRGPGETQLEVDRREIRKRISKLKSDLEGVRAHRSRYRMQRKRSHIPVISLVGYTNSGKSTFLNQVSGATIFAADKLFATLDPTTRRVQLPGGQSVLITDTVGFIQKLPTQLVAAFRATLEEIAESDLLIHVVDISHPNVMGQWESVQSTLLDLHADHIPVVTVLNKVDLLNDQDMVKDILAGYNNTFGISALTGEGLNGVLSAIEEILFENKELLEVIIPYQDGKMISMFHDYGQIKLVQNHSEGVTIKGYLPGELSPLYNKYRKKKPKEKTG